MNGIVVLCVILVGKCKSDNEGKNRSDCDYDFGIIVCFAILPFSVLFVTYSA